MIKTFNETTLCKRKIGEMCFSMVKIKYETIDDKNKKFFWLRGETKLKYHKIKSDFYDQMNYMRQSNAFRVNENIFSQNSQGIAMILHEAL